MAVVNGYSSAQVLAMQKDAIRRVNEMQRVAQEKVRQTQEALGSGPAVSGPASESRAPLPEAPPVSAPEKTEGALPEAEQLPIPAGNCEEAASPFQGILQRLNLDGETVLLLLMLLLLVNEGADSKLIMALVYILL